MNEMEMSSTKVVPINSARARDHEKTQLRVAGHVIEFHLVRA